MPERPPTVHAAWSVEELAFREDITKPISEDEISMAVASLPTHKACGPDEIYNEHIREAQSLIPLWCALFNECMERGVVPSEWCRGRMIVIPKTKVCPTDPKSWRGITKKSFVAKLFSGIILRRLVPFLDLRGCIPDQQHGFRAGRSTMSACYVLINDIEQALLTRLCN